MKVSSRLEVGQLYTRRELATLMEYGEQALKVGIFNPRRFESVLVFVTRDPNDTRARPLVNYDGEQLLVPCQPQGQRDVPVVKHKARKRELLLFYREGKASNPGNAFRFEGLFEYAGSRLGTPDLLLLTRLPAQIANQFKLPIRAHVPPQEALHEDMQLLLFTDAGTVVSRTLGAFKLQRRGGLGATLSHSGSTLRGIVGVPKATRSLLLITRKGLSIHLDARETAALFESDETELSVQKLAALQHDDDVACVLPIDGDPGERDLMLFTTQGRLKRTPLQGVLDSRNRRGWTVVALEHPERLVDAVLVRDDDSVLLTSDTPKVVRLEVNEVKRSRRTGRRLLKGIGLNEGESATGMCVVRSRDLLFRADTSGRLALTESADLGSQTRGSRGRTLYSSHKSTVLAVLAGSKADEVLAASSDGRLIRTEAKEFRVSGISTYGVQLMRLQEDAELSAVAVLRVRTQRKVTRRAPPPLSSGLIPAGLSFQALPPPQPSLDHRPSQTAASLQTRLRSPDELSFLKEMHDFAKGRGLDLAFRDLASLHLALKVRPLVLLAGPPGVGKTTLARTYAHALGCTRDRGNFAKVAVEAHWTDDRALLGDQGALRRLVSCAEALEEVMCSVLFDEFNMTRPEYYLSKVLSAMESDFSLCEAHDGSLVQLPTTADNRSRLLMMGTLNVDETSRPPADKVLDRAFIVELPLPRPAPRVRRASLNGDVSADSLVVPASTWSHWCNCASDWGVPEELTALLELFHANSSHATAHSWLGPSRRAVLDISEFMAFHSALKLDEHDFSRDAALDIALLGRVLPRIRGDGTYLESLLKSLVNYVDMDRWPRSARCLAGLLQQSKSGWVSYWS